MDTLVGLKDQRWRNVKSIITPTFTSSKMKVISEIINEKIQTMIKVMRNQQKDNEIIDVLDIYQRLSLDVISLCALALESDVQTNKNHHLLYIVKEFLRTAINSFIEIAIYFNSFGQLLGYISNKLAYSGRMTQLIISHLKKVIKIRRGYSDDGNKINDVLQMLLDGSAVSEDKMTTELKGNHEAISKKIKLTDSEVIANAWVFLLGGFDTTASSITLTSYSLACHQDVQMKLFNEIISVVPVSISLTISSY